MMPGPPLVDCLGPLRDQESQLAGIFVVPSHLNIGFGAAYPRLLFWWSEFRRARLVQQLQSLFGLRAAVETRGAEEHHGVLDAFPTETCQRLQVFRFDAQNTPIRAVQELRVLVRKGWYLGV
jgi:hypothetical protein